MSDPRNTISEFTLPDNTVVDLEDTQITPSSIETFG